MWKSELLERKTGKSKAKSRVSKSSDIKLKRVLIVAPFTLLHNEEGYNRFRYIAEILSTKHSVTLVTSSFNHPKKSQRVFSQIYSELPYEVRLLYEPGYKQNVGFRRISSHKVFEKNLHQYLELKNGEFDFVYAAFPLIESARCCQNFAHHNEIPFFIDVQDVWPESILVIFGRLSVIGKGLIYPLTLKANKVYKAADAVVSVSQTYADRVMRVNRKADVVLPLYIGIDIEKYDQAVKRSRTYGRRVSGEILGVYSGSMSQSYDVETVILASAELRDNGIPFKLIVIGNGPLERKLRSLAVALDAPVEFLGYLTFDQMAHVLNKADVGFHAISRYSQSSMTNKFADYCAAGLAILNSSSNSEICELVECEKLGCNYTAGDALGLAKQIESISRDLVQLSLFQVRSRDFAENQLNRRERYRQLFALFE